jgi:hypothetical protein
MESGRTLILKDLEDIYGSLYGRLPPLSPFIYIISNILIFKDMLNQNYVVVGKKKNCRIALGAFSNPMCNVHDDFRCIVLVDHRKIDFSDPPFLNRFEKQMIKYLSVCQFCRI